VSKVIASTPSSRRPHGKNLQGRRT